MKSNRNVKMCGKLQIELLVAAEVDAWRPRIPDWFCRPRQHAAKENPVDSCSRRKGIIFGLTVQNTPNNQSAVIRSGSVSVRSGSCCCFFIALWGHALILSQVSAQLSAV